MERLVQVVDATGPSLTRKIVELEAGTKYRVVLIESDEGYAVSCPELRGCHSQGIALEEALTSIKEAIREWLAVKEQQRAS